MIMQLAIKKAKETMNKNYGGPFGALIIKDNEIISISSNSVLKDNDPTAHAEINAIREASKKLQTYDLKDCILYTTSYPCPMCLSAIIWSNIKEIYYGADLEDAKDIGFRDDYIYDFIKNNNQGDILKMKQIDKEECLKLFQEYKSHNKTIY